MVVAEENIVVAVVVVVGVVVATLTIVKLEIEVGNEDWETSSFVISLVGMFVIVVRFS